MARLMDIFAYDRDLITSDLIECRYHASIRPGVQERFAAISPASRQQRLETLATPEKDIAAIDARALIVHGRGDRVIPLEAGLRLHKLRRHSEMHISANADTGLKRAGWPFCDLVNAFLLRD